MDSKVIEEALLNSINRREEMTKENIKKAELINFKTISDKIMTCDQFGFIKDDKNVSEPKLSDKEKQKILRKENSRLEKWSKMVSNYDIFVKSNFEKLKSRTRKGIPESFRALMWQTYAEIDAFRNDPNLAGMYQKLVNDETSDVEVESLILRDINRTFPKHSIFKEQYGLGQRKLFEVLRAYSKFNQDTGYVQGMGFIAGLMLTYMDDESSFWMIHSLMIKKKYHMIGYYYKDFPELKKSFFKLLSLMKKHVPKVYQLFKKMKVHPTMYSSQWFITLYIVSFPFNILVRFFDVFFLEGTKVIYRFALAVLKLNESELLQARTFEEVLEKMKKLSKCLDVERLFHKAFSFSISRDHLAEYDAKYELLKDSMDNEIIAQISY